MQYNETKLQQILGYCLELLLDGLPMLQLIHVVQHLLLMIVMDQRRSPMMHLAHEFAHKTLYLMMDLEMGQTCCKNVYQL